MSGESAQRPPDSAIAAMTPITSALPILGPALALRDGVSGDLSPLDATIAIATTVGWFAALTAAATRRVGDERRVLRTLG